MGRLALPTTDFIHRLLNVHNSSLSKGSADLVPTRPRRRESNVHSRKATASSSKGRLHLEVRTSRRSRYRYIVQDSDDEHNVAEGGSYKGYEDDGYDQGQGSGLETGSRARRHAILLKIMSEFNIATLNSPALSSVTDPAPCVSGPKLALILISLDIPPVPGSMLIRPIDHVIIRW